MIDHKKSILNSEDEVKLYAKEFLEPPPFLNVLFGRIHAVYQPRSTEKIREIFTFLHERNLGVLPRGAATYGMGGITPLKESVLVDLTHLDRIIGFDEGTHTVTCEGGTRWWNLKRYLNGFGYDLCTYPTSLFSTVGGWLSTGGYGINSFRYGHISRLVESIEVITPSGSVLLNNSDQRFKYFIGTEGQNGIISKATLKVRQLGHSKAFLFLFNTASRAMEFLGTLFHAEDIAPVHIAYYDRASLSHKNPSTNGDGMSFPALDGVLVVLDDDASEHALKRLGEVMEAVSAHPALSAYLWNERYFPFSVKRTHPYILGSEVIIPVENLSMYLERVKRFSKEYGIELSTEAVCISREQAVVFALFPSENSSIVRIMHLFISSALTELALGCGAVPYGMGTWNLPLRKKVFTRAEFMQYRDFKKRIDPDNILNAGKSLSGGSVLSTFLRGAHAFSGSVFFHNYVVKGFSRILSRKHTVASSDSVEPDSCANCSACTVVCPAYLVTGNELVTAKGKLMLMKRLREGEPVPKEIAESAFLCLHCALCEKVCQSKLKLNDTWDAFETVLQEKYARPDARIEAFIREAEAHPEYNKLLDSFQRRSRSCF
ncbi:MAG: hypothetical protein A2Y62_07460 [Candidatus Fischerbacteria bacterium RBG_13_37_8]|uniref:FAD-binding PCMH-type domain-containing protein n=1 Tax=Candidatus Fischerbacteria bacterium RBG_13_37_8 TaxID=1817863 RepID=A0A1F5VJ00_9BACT|nr:MAG: hypothetical protein A2Y62_07460 [Candidatus Fischerbacteria bacterium RBG_13_37_8]